MERITNMESVFEVVRKFLDHDITLTIKEWANGASDFIDHPFLTFLDFPSVGLDSQKDSMLAKVLANGETRLQLREKKWESLRKQSLKKIVLEVTDPYVLNFLADIIPCTSRDDFSVALGEAWRRDENSSLDSLISEKFTKEDFFELLSCCDFQKLMTDKESTRLSQESSCLTVYRSDVSETEPDQMFTWALEPIVIVDYLQNMYGEYECYGCYAARIKKEDVYACINCKGVALNPDKLYDVEHIGSVADLCDENDLPAKDEY